MPAQTPLRAELAGCGATAPVIDRTALERRLHVKLADWRGLLTRNLTTGRDVLRLVFAGPNRFTAVVADFDSGTVLPADRVELSGTPASHPDLGTARLELTEAIDGRWLGQGRMLSLAGRWNLTTTIQRPTGGIPVPLAIDVPPPAPS